MTKKSMLLAGWIAVELSVTVWIGYRIATAREHGWSASLKKKKGTKK